MSQRPACSGVLARSYRDEEYDARVLAADELLKERTFVPLQSWTEVFATQEHRNLALAQSRNAGAGDKELIMLRQSTVDLSRGAQREMDLLVQFGPISRAELEQTSATQPLTVSIDGHSLMRDLLAGSSPSMVHARFPVLVERIDILEADLRGLAVPSSLTLQTVFTHNGSQQIQQWCQGTVRTFTPSTVHGARGSGSSMARSSRASVDANVIGTVLDGHVLLGADCHITEPRGAYAMPLHVVLVPSVRTVLSIDFQTVRNQLGRSLQQQTYRPVISSEHSADPNDEAGWLLLHLLSSLPHFMQEAAAGAAVDVDRKDFLFQNSAKAHCANVPAAPTDGLVAMIEQQCRQHELCFAEDMQSLRVNLHSTATSGTWRTVGGVTELRPSVRLRLTYTWVPRSLQSQATASQ